VSKWPALLFCAVVALAFGAGGLVVGVMPLNQILSLALGSRHWEPVQATLLDVKLETGRKGTAAVHARYRYEFRGKSYESARVGTGVQSSDDIGTWQRDWYRRLDAARDAERAVTAWVDPQRPDRALLDRAVRWGMVAFHIPFALLFTAIGVAGLWGFCYLLVTPAEVLKRRRGRKFKEEDRRVRMAGLWLLALYWCGLSGPMAALVWLEPQPWLTRVLVTLFALTGLGLLKAAFTMTLDRRRSSMDRTSAS
jgi:hypothetical protein